MLNASQVDYARSHAGSCKCWIMTKLLKKNQFGYSTPEDIFLNIQASRSHILPISSQRHLGQALGWSFFLAIIQAIFVYACKGRLHFHTKAGHLGQALDWSFFLAITCTRVGTNRTHREVLRMSLLYDNPQRPCV
ncbi:hypothetical protein VNO77_44151 [Canavalia gladiata]|uniref:Uncharacterized protein n=1 Tax=Canavalia gladiata TaxID=3824 RepID=A0AAN9JVE4_CANGL